MKSQSNQSPNQAVPETRDSWFGDSNSSSSWNAVSHLSLPLESPGEHEPGQVVPASHWAGEAGQPANAEKAPSALRNPCCPTELGSHTWFPSIQPLPPKHLGCLRPQAFSLNVRSSPNSPSSFSCPRDLHPEAWVCSPPAPPAQSLSLLPPGHCSPVLSVTFITALVPAAFSLTWAVCSLLTDLQ